MNMYFLKQSRRFFQFGQLAGQVGKIVGWVHWVGGALGDRPQADKIFRVVATPVRANKACITVSVIAILDELSKIAAICGILCQPGIAFFAVAQDSGGIQTADENVNQKGIGGLSGYLVAISGSVLSLLCCLAVGKMNFTAIGKQVLPSGNNRLALVFSLSQAEDAIKTGLCRAPVA
ncbi:MAG: hypothetical protein OXC81_06700, partial [Betaproteobacteria bacterium]|nr:hypothetical protein [Betaproteobacteria bacterium]